MSPSDLRKQPETEIPVETLTCELGYRPPYDWDSFLSFHKSRASCGVERVENNRYIRTIWVGEKSGWIVVQPIEARSIVKVEMSANLASVLPSILAKIKHFFDLDAQPLLIDEHLSEFSKNRPGLRVPGAFDGFEMCVRAILGQQVSVQAATTLMGRFVRAFGAPIETPHETITHLAPTAEQISKISEEAINALGITKARSHSLLILAKTMANGDLVLEPNVEPQETMEKMKTLPGIGEWTAQYVAMRALGFPDAFPHTDLGVMKALNEKNPKKILELSKAWQPWRAYAVMHIWNLLENKPTK